MDSTRFVTTRKRAWLLTVGLLGFVIVTGMAHVRGAAATAPVNDRLQPAAAPVWLDADGNPLPFQTDEEILEFLRTADVVSVEDIPIGTTNPQMVTLEKDGVRVNAAFRDVDVTHERVGLSDGSFRMNLRDYSMFECAAYEVAQLLGLDNVPPTVERRIRRQLGSLQLWLENVMMEQDRVERRLQGPGIKWLRQMQTMYIFDDLIGNDDRNAGNILIDPDWKLWLIDHTRAFQVRLDSMNIEKIIWCERGLWQKLQSLDVAQLTSRVDEFVTDFEIREVLRRRDLLVAHIQRLIDERGEGAVIFERP